MNTARNLHLLIFLTFLRIQFLFVISLIITENEILGPTWKNNNSRILVAFYASEVSKCNLVLGMSNVQSSKNVGGGFFLHDIRWQFSDIYKYFQAMFSGQFLNISVFSFSTVSIIHRVNMYFYFACLSLNLTAITFTYIYMK